MHWQQHAPTTMLHSTISNETQRLRPLRMRFCLTRENWKSCPTWMANRSRNKCSSNKKKRRAKSAAKQNQLYPHWQINHDYTQAPNHEKNRRDTFAKNSTWNIHTWTLLVWKTDGCRSHCKRPACPTSNQINFWKPLWARCCHRGRGGDFRSRQHHGFGLSQTWLHGNLSHSWLHNTIQQTCEPLRSPTITTALQKCRDLFHFQTS